MMYNISMKMVTSYTIAFKDGYDAVKRTTVIFNDAIRYLTDVALEQWEVIEKIRFSKGRMNLVEKLVHETSGNKPVYRSFDRRFYKLPCYLRRNAIMEALGNVQAYMSNIDSWVKNGCRGAKPKLDKGGHVLPCLYRKGMYREGLGDEAYIKVFRNSDWVWQKIRLNHSDRKYLEKKAKGTAVSAPTIVKKHGKYELRFALAREVELSSKEIYEQKACAVDLGITTDATCCVMDAHGTVLSRRFITCGREKDQVNRALHRVSEFQREHGSHDSGRLWNIAKRRNLNLARLVAHKIVNYAIENGCDVIVFEHLDTKGRKRGGKKQKLTMWKHADIQNTVTSLAHQNGMRISRICAWNTSRLAYDGSGEVLRGNKVSDATLYDMCKFQSGKMYNCDLSASYNIGARYFIRGLIKELPDIMAEVPDIGSGTARTLSTLWKISSAVSI